MKHNECSMCGLFSQIREAVRKIEFAETENFQNGLHLKTGKTDDGSVRLRYEIHMLRADRLCHLADLLADTLAPGIKAGFSGEHVAASLEKLIASVEEAAYWNENCPAYDLEADESEMECCIFSEAGCIFSSLFDQANRDLKPLAVWAAAAAADPVSSPAKDAGQGHGTVRDVARFLRVSPDKIRKWIQQGKLKAINTADAMCSRPRYVILPHHIAEFETVRHAGPNGKKVPQKKRSDRTDYYP